MKLSFQGTGVEPCYIWLALAQIMTLLLFRTSEKLQLCGGGGGGSGGVSFPASKAVLCQVTGSFPCSIKSQLMAILTKSSCPFSFDTPIFSPHGENFSPVIGFLRLDWGGLLRLDHFHFGGGVGLLGTVPGEYTGP